MSTTFFWVPGLPVTKGSAIALPNKRTGRPVVVQERRKELKSWAAAIRMAAAEVGARTLEGAVTLDLEFRLPRPKRHHGKSGAVHPSAPLAHAVKPDLDKLVRAVGDSLCGVLYHDDAQVATITARKIYAAPGECPGVAIEAWSVES